MTIAVELWRKNEAKAHNTIRSKYRFSIRDAQRFFCEFFGDDHNFLQYGEFVYDLFTGK